MSLESMLQKRKLDRVLKSKYQESIKNVSNLKKDYSKQVNSLVKEIEKQV